MQYIRFNASKAEFVSNAIRNNSQTLVSFDYLAKIHLNIAQELVLCCPPIAMVEDNMALGNANHSSCGGGYPKLEVSSPLIILTRGAKSMAPPTE
ncbi:MAG TPA: hypothetical protein VIS72_15125 [Anaerolineales bacterium]